MDLPAAGAPEADRRPDGVRRARDPGLQAAVGVGLSHPRGRGDGRAGAGVHPRRRVRLRRAGPVAGWTSSSSRPGLSFFFDAHIDFFEEIAKLRAARRIWARWLRDVYGAKTDKALSLRFHTQTAGVSLTAQQPDNNIVRTAVEALAAILAGTNSLHTNALDEVLALPSEKSAQIALRTQQVIAEETGVLNVADPLGGSWYVEALTDQIEAEAETIFARIKEVGGDGTITAGLLRGIEDGWFIGEIADSAFAYQVALEKGDKRVVGVNTLTGDVGDELEILRVSHEVELAQRALVIERRAARDQGAVDAALARMVAAAEADENTVPAMLDAARAEATLGEICNAFKPMWGEYREAARF